MQFQHSHFLLPQVMVSTHPVHAQNSSNTVLAIKYCKTNKHCSLAYHIIYHRLHKPYPPSGGTCFVLHCMCIPMRQARPTPSMLCCVFTTAISHFSSETIPTYSTCTCPYPIPISILCASTQETYSPCQIWAMDAPFWCIAPLHMHFMHSKQIHFICSAIPILFHYFHPSKPLTRLRHTTRTFKIRHFGYSVPEFQRPSMPASTSPLPHLHTLSAILVDVHHFTLQPSMNCLPLYISHQLYHVRGFNVGTFLHQHLCNFNMAISCCPK